MYKKNKTFSVCFYYEIDFFNYSSKMIIFQMFGKTTSRHYTTTNYKNKFKCRMIKSNKDNTGGNKFILQKVFV